MMKDIALFSDSLSSLTAVKAGISLNISNTINEIYDLVDSLDVNTTMIWIPSHLGLERNEIADQLARCAAENNPVVDTPLRLKEFSSKIQNYMLLQNGKTYGAIVILVNFIEI